MRTKLDLSTVPVGVLIVLGIVLLLEIVLDVIALADLYRRPVARVTLGNKWIWVAVIVLINLIGAILYFAIGRKPAPAGEQPSGEGPVAKPARSAAEIAEALYGDPDRPKQS
ncbi:MAG TPA: PLD nuclease N-terminal domain-containing protein [Pseudolysinimonas sp.]|nr:PLD nuclease N-terminal domain-containing protein [Pseudolysinimonas sp.]